MEFKPFSPRQMEALSWWCASSPHRGRDAVICDGAVRSGKTLCLSLSFVLWAMSCFHGESFAICGKTIISVRRNLLEPLLGVLEGLGVRYTYKVSAGELAVEMDGNTNRFYLFGGKDEGSAALIQGITLAGVLLDEVALMPRSFVEQALARCSVAGSKFFFNCNPEHPAHWFYTEWIEGAAEKNALYLHFTMKDNPSLEEAVRKRYESLYTGVFYQRYVLGEWVAAHGAVYPMFHKEEHVVEQVPQQMERFAVSCDYGTVNPASFGLWGESGGRWYRMAEYYHDSRVAGVQRTDEEYAEALLALAGGRALEAVVVDPSAASFVQCLRRKGVANVVPAKNDVLDGIRLVAGALAAGMLRFHKSCKDTIREFSLYRWDLEAGRDAPVKEYDHAMDDIRYFAAHAFGQEERQGFAVLAAERRKRE